MSMEIPFMDHVRHSLMIDRNKDVIIDKLLNLTLEIICLLTGEDYVVVRRSADLCASEQRGRHVSDECSEVQGLISGDSSPSPPLTEDNPPPGIPEPGRNLHRDTQKLPIKSEEAEVCVWDHSADQRGAVEVGAPELRSADSSLRRMFESSVKGHRDTTDPTPHYVSAAHREGSPPRKCRTPECSQGQAPPSGDGTFHQCKEEEDSAVPGDVGAGGDDITHHQDQCLVDFIEEESETTAQEYQPDVRDGTLHLPSKEEAAPDYMTSGSAISSLHHSSQDQRQSPPDPAVHPKFPCTNNPFSCSICGVRFGSETTFAAHRRYHAEEKSYSCTYCGKSFNQRSRLLSHKRKHTGEKPFSCPVCGRCFAERSALVAHQRIHSGEKPFNCTECARSFVQRSSLVKHQRIHTGEQPFVCSQCGRRFSQSSNLVRHQRILHHFI